ncbi:ABC transporter ATP-binding protein [Phyllobacterium salinisoli]|uniref:ABC transporter ATP-binding protein n=1 Tax=Phyllobacterium salinisoli TaxID=1899321 RepID=A0A368JY36_9HYPH|nr:ABC transporter transmembrane domain-containing protein [Phyllobacterium salinisoli]RCS22059.1 ABC transporter ATP-binding protein [Phyllobacterium salinisoli]
MTAIPPILSRSRGALFTTVCGAGLAEAAAMGLAAFATRELFAALHDGRTLPLHALMMLGGAGAGVALARFTNRIAAESLGQRFATAVRHTLYAKIAALPQADLARRRRGAWALRFVGDLTILRNWAGNGLPQAATAAIVLPCAALALWLLNPRLALAGMAPILAALLSMAALTVIFDPIQRGLRSGRAAIATRMIERLAYAPQLDLMGRTQQELRRLDERGQRLRKSAVRRTAAYAGLRMIPDLGAVAGGVLVLWIAARSGASGAEAAAALAVLGMIASPLRALAFTWDRYSGWRVAREKLQAVFDLPDAGRTVERFTRDAASLTVPDGRPVPAGAVLGLTGADARAKTEWLTRLAGLENRRPPVSPGVRFRTALIEPGAPILQGSLRRNLTLGVRPRPSDEAITNVARRLGLAPLMQRLTLDGRVAEGGRGLGRDELARLLMARAALTRPALLLIDMPEIFADAGLMAAMRNLIANLHATTVVSIPAGAPRCIADLTVDAAALLDDAGCEADIS